MLPDKGTKNLSELKNFFTTNEKAFFPLYNTLVNNLSFASSVIN